MLGIWLQDSFVALSSRPKCVLFPVHLQGNHWALAVYWLNTKTLYMCEGLFKQASWQSISLESEERIAALVGKLMDAKFPSSGLSRNTRKKQRAAPATSDSVQLEYLMAPSDFPTQEDAHSCGIAVVAAAAALSCYLKSNRVYDGQEKESLIAAFKQCFSQSDYSAARIGMLREILLQPTTSYWEALCIGRMSERRDTNAWDYDDSEDDAVEEPELARKAPRSRTR